MLPFIIISKFQCCYLVLAHKLPLAFQLISGKSQSLQWLAKFFHGLTSWYLCAHILVLTSKLPPHWTNTGLPAVHQTSGMSFLRAFILAFFSTSYSHLQALSWLTSHLLQVFVLVALQ